MNSKTIFSLTALAAATVASAVTTDNTLCRITVPSTAKSTIVAVPFAKIAEGTAIPVTELVLTDNLSDGDTLLHKNGANWDAWVVADGAWKPLTITEGMSTTWTKGADEATLACGDAIWVNREVTTNPFYIYGQIPVGAVTKPAIVRSAYTMMGNTTLAPAAASSLYTGTPQAGDKIVWANPANGTGTTELEYKDGAWGMTVSTVVEKNGRKIVMTSWTTTDLPQVPAGQGVWYVAK